MYIVCGTCLCYLISQAPDGSVNQADLSGAMFNLTMGRSPLTDADIICIDKLVKYMTDDPVTSPEVSVLFPLKY